MYLREQATIQQLKQELEKAWKMVDAATERETRARETIQTLKLEIANLTKLVEQGAGLSMGQEHRCAVHCTAAENHHCAGISLL